jgi:pyridoxal/pyridoxine/pyridoxamine kinase
LSHFLRRTAEGTSPENAFSVRPVSPARAQGPERGRREDIPAHPLNAEPTGAGDAFATAYLVARNAGFTPAAAARRATAVVASLMSPS